MVGPEPGPHLSPPADRLGRGCPHAGLADSLLHVFPNSAGLLHGEPVADLVIEDFLWDRRMREHRVDSDRLFVAKSIRKSGAPFGGLEPENRERTLFHS